MSEEEEKLIAEADSFIQKFEEAMDDDFNTADAVSALFELVKFANTHAGAGRSAEFLQNLLDKVVKLSDILGLIVLKKRRFWMRI